MKPTRECPFCYSEIDARATVCPHCRRDIAPAVLGPVPAIDELPPAPAAQPEAIVEAAAPKKSSLTAKQFLFFIVLAAFLKQAEELMVAYLLAHRTDNAANKASARERAARIGWPSCAADAWVAVRDWMNAVDAGDQAGMTAADERFLLVFR